MFVITIIYATLYIFKMKIKVTTINFIVLFYFICMFCVIVAWLGPGSTQRSHTSLPSHTQTCNKMVSWDGLIVLKYIFPHFWVQNFLYGWRLDTILIIPHIWNCIFVYTSVSFPRKPYGNQTGGGGVFLFPAVLTQILWSVFTDSIYSWVYVPIYVLICYNHMFVFCVFENEIQKLSEKCAHREWLTSFRWEFDLERSMLVCITFQRALHMRRKEIWGLTYPTHLYWWQWCLPVHLQHFSHLRTIFYFLQRLGVSILRHMSILQASTKQVHSIVAVFGAQRTSHQFFGMDAWTVIFHIHSPQSPELNQFRTWISNHINQKTMGCWTNPYPLNCMRTWPSRCRQHQDKLWASDSISTNQC